MNRTIAAGLFLLLVCVSLPATLVAADPANEKALAKEIDAVMSAVYKPGEPGAAVIVRRGGKTLFRKGYGMANLELGVAVEPDMVFRLGSITKQFTAVSILLLAERGLLTLEDGIEKHLPGFPAGDRKVTIAHLLGHTSGIRSYTDMEEWLKMWRRDMTPAEIIAMSGEKPFDFEPGARWSYCNTGYVMLGAIIEKVSGRSYGEFVNENIFRPLGMTRSGYDHTEVIVPRRVAGYQRGKLGFVNAPYLSMTQPYAAGSLLSSVDDLAAWNDALLGGRVLKKESLRRAFTPFTLTDGESTGYGCGWMVADLRGHRTVEHGGGIMGFTSYALCLPDDGIYVAVLTNCAGAGSNPEPRAVRIAELALGLEAEEFKPASLSTADLDSLAGVYENRAGEARYISREGNVLYSQRAGGGRYPLQPVSATEFRLPDSPTLIRFTTGGDGRVSGLRLWPRTGPAETYRRTDKPLPHPRKEISLAPEKLARFAGEYELMPGFTIVVTLENGRLMAQPTGQPKFEIFAESETAFFLKVVDARILFDADSDGRVAGLTLLQGGQRLPGRRIR